MRGRTAGLALCAAFVSGWPSALEPPHAQSRSSPAALTGFGGPVVISSGQWRLRGDFVRAEGAGRHPAALLLNKAGGDRTAYQTLATELARRGISSLRVDLRGHGESTNAGRFVPGTPGATAILEGTPDDVTAALTFLQADPTVDRHRLVVVGASYSAEAMAEAARASRHYAAAYVALSPGNFSETSAAAIDTSGARWLVIRSARETSPSVKAATQMVRDHSKSAQLWVLDASTHATDVLTDVAELPSRLADWIAAAVS